MPALLDFPLTPANTLADLHLGKIPLERIRMQPAPGTATIEDADLLEQKENRLFELYDGVLVEKPMGYNESDLAMYLGYVLNAHVIPRKLGKVTGPDGMLEIPKGQLRMPDVAFVSRRKLVQGPKPRPRVPRLVPDLAVEVLSRSNTREEMARKRREYFAAGVIQVWQVDPKKRIVDVFTAPETFTTLTEKDTLHGEPFLPGFELKLSELFAQLDD
ncbi:MAG TPA: Uma2 family endonuclease [Planctomycetota bacterium]|nr:Uma2 family endonuclease [Planctomycetota bacterium]